MPEFLSCAPAAYLLGLGFLCGCIVSAFVVLCASNYALREPRR